MKPRQVGSGSRDAAATGQADVDLPRTRADGAPTDDELETTVIRIYLSMLQHPAPSRALLLAQGIAEATVDRVVDILSHRGLVAVQADGSWDVIAPDVALPALAGRLENRARYMRASAFELTQIYFHARAAQRAAPERVQVLHSVDDVGAATQQLVAAARESLVAMRDCSARTEALFQAPLSSHRDRTSTAEGGELDSRTVFDVQVLDLDDAPEVLTARRHAGERARFTSGIPFSTVVVDDVGAVVDISRYESSGQGSLLVRFRPLVLALRSLVEGFWQQGAPLDTISLDAISQDGLDRRDATILSLLAAGASDASIARQARVSQRTVERRVRALMDRLGAGTRFQAGVQAARRGWL